MKIRYLIALIAITLSASSCYNEAPIVPSEGGSAASDHEFPQGDSPADQRLVEVYEKYGVKAIYKDFTEEDWQRSWTGSGGSSSNMDWDYVPEDKIDEVADVMEIVFDFLPSEYLPQMFYPYFYVIDNLHITSFVGTPHESTAYYFTPPGLVSMDSKTFSIHTQFGRDNYSQRIYGVAEIIWNMIQPLVRAGTITFPDGYRELADYSLGALPSFNASPAGSTNYSNFWARRGFFPFPNSANGHLYGSRSWATQTSSYSHSIEQEFLQIFQYLILEPNLEEKFQPGQIYDNCPTLVTRMNMFLNHMKDSYGMDLRALNTRLFEGYTGDTSIDRFSSEDPDGYYDYTYIYY